MAEELRPCLFCKSGKGKLGRGPEQPVQCQEYGRVLPMADWNTRAEPDRIKVLEDEIDAHITAYNGLIDDLCHKLDRAVEALKWVIEDDDTKAQTQNVCYKAIREIESTEEKA